MQQKSLLKITGLRPLPGCSCFWRCRDDLYRDQLGVKNAFASKSEYLYFFNLCIFGPEGASYLQRCVSDLLWKSSRVQRRPSRRPHLDAGERNEGDEGSAFASGIETVHCDQQLRQHCLSEPSRGQPSSSFLSALMSEAPRSPFSRIIFIICTTITSPAQPTVSTTHPCSSGDEKCSRRARLAPLARQIQLITACLGLTSARRRSGEGRTRGRGPGGQTGGRADRQTGRQGRAPAKG